MITLYDEPAFIVHKRPYNDTSTLIQFLTAEHGRTTALSRQSAKMMGKVLQPFILSKITCGGRGQLPTLRQFDPQGVQLLATTKQRMIGMYVNELLVRLTLVRSASHQLFELYHECITQLAENANIERTLRRFEMGLLETARDGLQLSYDYVTMEPLTDEAIYTYRIDSGATLARGSEADTYSGRTLIALRDGLQRYDEQILSEAKRLLRYVIDCELSGEILQTRMLFRYLSDLV